MALEETDGSRQEAPVRGPAWPPDGLALALDRVGKEYPGGVAALREITVQIPIGDQVAVVGPSGSGKTTLLTILGTLERPSSGAVRVAGHDVVKATDNELAGLRAHHIGFVFQTFHLQEYMTALDNVANGMLYMGVSLRERRLAATAALERVGLDHRLTHRPSELSGGERQRVAIARALAGEPRLILADEPTGNLDSARSREIVELLHAIARERDAAVLLVTHDLEAAAIADRRCTLRDGRLSVDGVPSAQR